MPDSSPQPSMFRRTAKVFALVHVGVIALVITIVLVAKLVTDQPHGTDDDNAALARIKPVGEVLLAQAGPAAGSRTGEEVYAQVCRTCHEAGLVGALKFGDKAAWSKVLAQGADTVFAHALNGIRAMPPRGGNPDLTDDEVKRGVVHMANAVGANWKAPAPAPTTATATAAATPPGPPPAAAAAAAPAGTAATAQATTGKPDGKKVYDSSCAACHTPGIAGAPKLGDTAAWAPRLKTGMDALYASALKGKGVMPPKGGNTALADPDVKAAVDYLTAASK